MRRITIGIVIGVAAMLLVNVGRYQWRQWQWRHDRTYWNWQYRELPILLDAQVVFPLEMMSQRSKWPPRTSFDSIMVYQKTNVIKAIRVHAVVNNGVFTPPSADEIRAMDANAPSMPVPPDTRSNTVPTSYGNFLSYAVAPLTESLSSLIIRNRSGRDFRTMTVVRGDGPTLTMRDLSNGSTRSAFIPTQAEKTQVIRLRGHIENGDTFETNFTVLVTSERRIDVDVEIDEDLIFHVTEMDDFQQIGGPYFK